MLEPPEIPRRRSNSSVHLKQFQTFSSQRENVHRLFNILREIKSSNCPKFFVVCQTPMFISNNPKRPPREENDPLTAQRLKRIVDCPVDTGENTIHISSTSSDRIHSGHFRPAVASEADSWCSSPWTTCHHAVRVAAAWLVPPPRFSIIAVRRSYRRVSTEPPRGRLRNNEKERADDTASTIFLCA